MKLSELTYDILVQIVKIYDETVGASGIEHLHHPSQIEKVHETIGKFWNLEWRFGSKFSMHSKLWIKIKSRIGEDDILVYFHFGPNFDPRSKKEKREAEQIQKKFAKKVDEFLVKNNLQVKQRL